MLGERGTGQGRHRLSQKSTRTNGFTVSLFVTLGIMLTLVYLVQRGFSVFPSCLIQFYPIKKSLEKLALPHTTDLWSHFSAL